jgi:hypothetical protein
MAELQTVRQRFMSYDLNNGIENDVFYTIVARYLSYS